VVRQILADLQHNGIDMGTVGVITPYRGQVKRLKELLDMNVYPGLEISTVDSFQGREKEIMILSLVRSNDKHQVGFLSEEKRLNVAITRAKRMMAVVCDSRTLLNHLFLGEFVQWLLKDGSN